MKLLVELTNIKKSKLTLLGKRFVSSVRRLFGLKS